MDLPTQPVTLEPPQIEDLARHFSSFRHDVNGCLALIVAATELIRYKPELVQRMGHTIIEQPPKIAGKVSEFIEQQVKGLERSSVRSIRGFDYFLPAQNLWTIL